MMREWGLTFGESAALFALIVEVLIILVALIWLALMRYNTGRRESKRRRLRDALAELLPQVIDAPNDAALYDRTLKAVERVPADLARTTLTEMAEYMATDAAHFIYRRLFLDAGLANAARINASRRPWERLRVIREARALGDPADLLTKLINDDDIAVQLGAFEALGSLSRAEEALPALPKVARDGRLSRSRAIESLAAADPLPIESMRVMADDESPHVRQVIVGAFGRAHCDDAIDVMVAAVTDVDVEVRIEALRALTELEDRAALPAAIEALRDEFWEVRSRAVQCVAKLGGDAAVPHLAPLLDDSAEWVRHNCALALSRCGPSGVAALQEAAARGNDNASSALAEARLAREGT